MKCFSSIVKGLMSGKYLSKLVVAMLVAGTIFVMPSSLTAATPADIAGTWNYLYDYPYDHNGGGTWYLSVDGKVSDDSGYIWGTWGVSGSTFTLTYTSGNESGDVFTGTIVSNNTYMSGTAHNYSTGEDGTWNATKVGSSSAGTVQFSASSASVNENAGSVTLTVTRSGGSSGAASVNYATANGTAIAGTDYTTTSGQFTWADGNSDSKTIIVVIVNRSGTQGSRTFTVTLSGASGASLGSTYQATMTIADVGSAGTVQLSASSVSVNENVGLSWDLRVTRTGGSSGSAYVTYATVDGTAKAGEDYTSDSETIYWPDGNVAEQWTTARITDDDSYEGNETFTVVLSEAYGASLGSPSSATVTIVDNEIPPPTFSPEGGVYGAPLFVTVSHATEGVVMHYTTDGSDPTENDLPLFSGERVWIDHTTTLKAKAWKSGITASQVKSATYSLPLEVSISIENGWRHLVSGAEITLHATVQNDVAPVGYSWNLADASDASGINTATPKARYAEGSWLISVTVNDGTATATAYYLLTINKPLVSGEPVVKPLADVVDGTACDSSGTNEVDLSTNRNGLIVLIHGMTGKGTDPWLGNLENAINSRLANPQSRPDIVRWDWADMADPFRVTGNSKPMLPIHLIGNLSVIQPNGTLQGVLLAEWIKEQAIAQNIDTSKPIQLIGHSAGGFVAGECARVLKDLNLDIISQVTMLDTPCPIKSHFDEYPSPHRVERYISSAFGATIFEFRTPGDINIFQLCAEYLDGIDLIWMYAIPSIAYGNRWYMALQRYFSPPFISSDGNYYYRKEIPQWGGQLEATVAAHGDACTWYQNSCAAGSDGFGRSPFLNPSLRDTVKTDWGVRRQLRADAIDGFSTFGNVTLSEGNYTITEGEGNAGIFKTVEFPAGAKEVSFNYRFTSAGDGDYLGVYVGTNNGLYIGPDVQITRNSNVEGSVDVVFTVGSTEQLIFKLISRGSQNAQVTISSIALVVEGVPMSGDLDGDGKADAMRILNRDWYVWYSLLGYQVVGPYELTVAGMPLIADFDGDGKGDPAVMLSEDWYVCFSSMNYPQGGPYALGVSGLPLASDFDGDGMADPAVVSNGNWYVWFSGSGYTRGGPYSLGEAGSMPLAADFDGDGKADPAEVDFSGNWKIRLSASGYPQVSAIFTVSSGTPVAGDFDGDGKADPAEVDSSGNWYVWFSASGYVRGGPYALTAP